MDDPTPPNTAHPAIANLPEWLRFHGKHNACPDDHADCEWRSMLDAAANEIERLRAALEETGGCGPMTREDCPYG